MNSKPIGIFMQVDFLYREGRGGGRKWGISLEKRERKPLERERFGGFLFFSS
jgi:hypothetical protein